MSNTPKDNISNPKDFGWIKLHRKIRGHWLYTEKRKFSKYEAWLDLVMDANHHIGKVVIGNTVVPVPRGSTLTSIKKLAVRWGWSRHKTDDFLKALKKDTMIEHKKDTHFTLISIVNYDSYQSSENQKGHKKDTKKDINGTSTGHKQEEEERKKYSQNSDEFRLAQLLLDLICERKPDFRNAQPNRKQKTLERWAVHVDWMIRLDHRKPERIEQVIQWCQADTGNSTWSGWQNNILSTEKLRKQFDTLELSMGSNRDGTIEVAPFDKGAAAQREKMLAAGAK